VHPSAYLDHSPRSFHARKRSIPHCWGPSSQSELAFSSEQAIHKHTAFIRVSGFQNGVSRSTDREALCAPPLGKSQSSASTLQRPKQPEMHCKSLRLLLSPETRAIAGTNLSWCIVFKSSQHIMLLHVHLSTTLCFLHNNLQLLWQSSVSHLENALSHLLARRMRSYEHQTSNMKSVIFALYLCFG